MKRVLLMLTLLAVFMTATAAFAHHKPDHDKGPGHKDEQSQEAAPNKGEGPGGKNECNDYSGEPQHNYSPTCEPEHEPGNGSENGKAKGQPCAGCVGNADNKNPPGQAPDGSDSNNGYECDGNQGVGKENPAHTGCITTAPTPTPTPTPCTPGTPPCPTPTPTPTPCTPGSPPCPTPTPSPSCTPTDGENKKCEPIIICEDAPCDDQTCVEMHGKAACEPDEPGLPFTGAQIITFLILAGALLGIGTAMVVSSRK